MRKKLYFYSTCLIGIVTCFIFNTYTNKKQSADFSSYMTNEVEIDPEASFTSSNSTEQDILDLAKESPEIKLFLENVKSIKDGTSKTNSVEEFLKSTPALLKSYYTLAYHSRSIQGSSFLNPRAIVFSPNGHLVYSFNGDKAQPGYNSLEYILFNERTKEFEFREIDFSKPIGHQLVESPNKCLGCHASANMNSVSLHTLPHPLWDNYFLWPGIYGSNDDEIFRNHTKQFGFEKRNNQQFQKQSVEFQKYKAYLQNAKIHPRYSQLLPNRAKYNDGDGIELRPNLYLNERIRDMMGQFMAHQILNNSFIQEHLADFLNYLGGGFDSITGVYKIAVTKSEENTQLMKSLWDISNKSRIQRLKQDFNDPTICDQYERGCDEYLNNQGGEPESLASFKTMLDPTGIDFRSYAIDLYPRTGSMRDGDHGNAFFHQFPAYLAQEACGKSFPFSVKRGSEEYNASEENIMSLRGCLQKDTSR